MNNIYLYWYKMKGEGKNFGDELGPYLVNKLSGYGVSYVPILDTPIRIILRYAKGIIRGNFSIKDFLYVLKSLRAKKVLITVGSIIEWNNNLHCKVWGSGLMYRYGIIKKANFYAVRGKITQLRLNELGYKAPEVIGDPALLLPLIYKPMEKKRYKLGIIAHYIHYQETCKLFYNSEVLVINLFEDVEKVVEDINSCNVTISSSLHGIIVSHSYGIPCLWYNLPGQKLTGDNIKFSDYFSSVGISEYPAFDFIDTPKYNIDEIINNVKSNCSINETNEHIMKIQKNLLRVAPFPLLNEYKKFIIS